MPMPINNLSPTGAALGLGGYLGWAARWAIKLVTRPRRSAGGGWRCLRSSVSWGLAAVRLRRHCLVARCWAALVFKSTEQTHDEPYPASATKCAV
jgi:hypothetical protein